MLTSWMNSNWLTYFFLQPFQGKKQLCCSGSKAGHGDMYWRLLVVLVILGDLVWVQSSHLSQFGVIGCNAHTACIWRSQCSKDADAWHITLQISPAYWAQSFWLYLYVLSYICYPWEDEYMLCFELNQIILLFLLVMVAPCMLVMSALLPFQTPTGLSISIIYLLLPISSKTYYLFVV